MAINQNMKNGENTR